MLFYLKKYYHRQSAVRSPTSLFMTSLTGHVHHLTFDRSTTGHTLQVTLINASAHALPIAPCNALALKACWQKLVAI